uniref:riboflavin kinase n=1 Tax=Pithovirus LCDPAC01 TaxID=2506600 RepID=A0A481YQB8_9VIRU|nr:MAG: riboflavin kinase [Pithovirus LCDPAC01]
MYSLKGKVVKGLGRGSKLLGYPTANMDGKISGDIRKGVYCGWAKVGNGEVYKAFISVGYNPHFNNRCSTVETYILHEFSDDFYGAPIRVILCSYIRKQKAFSGVDELIKAITSDIDKGTKILDNKYMSVKNRNFFNSVS